MKRSRRNLLLAGLGAAQLALLERFGLGVLSPRVARAAPAAPTKLLTIYVPGGWMPVYLFCPLSTADIQKALPEPMMAMGEATYFAPEQVKNIDGSGDADAGSKVQRLRVPALWDEQALSMKMPDPHKPHPATGLPTTSHGWSWVEYKLWENAAVVHGVDQGTATHASGLISAMCGAAGAEYRAPSMHAVAANALYEKFKDQRPLPSVSVGGGPEPVALDLPAVVAPTILSSTQSLEWLLSERNDKAWAGFRTRAPGPQVDFQGNPIGDISTTAIDAYAMRATLAQKGRSSEGTDAFLEDLYEGYQGVSKVLARDIVSTLEKTKGVEHIGKPFWAFGNSGPFGATISTNIADSGGTWQDRFELALRILKSDLATSVSLYCPGLKGFYFDTHGSGPGVHFAHVRPAFDIIGRLLGEMKATPGSSGGTLLDETLVVIFSEFARTWPHAGDHWPTTSVVLAGGGIKPNQMIGSYDVASGSSFGYLGTPVDLIDEGGDPISRAPRSADIAHTVYRAMGVEEFFIPGGSAEIVGVRAT